MRSILVTVDDTPSSLAARRLAAALALRTGAQLHGVTGFEMADLDRGELAPLGGAEYAYNRLQQRERQARDRRARVAALPQAFESSMAAQGLEAPCSVMESDVRSELLQRIETCDLVITGRDAEFHLEPAEHGVTPLVEHVIQHGSRPVLVTGPAVPDGGPVLVAYDGSLPAAKSLQMAVLVGMLEGTAVHVLSMGQQHSEARAVAGRAAAFLQAHGIEPQIDTSESHDDPAAQITRRAGEIGARLLVMGAFGHRRLRDVLFGSCTRHLFDAVPLPLFIYH
ncbi:universal stress protein [Reyranella sp.]|uniref:universal stress protein n=1 Tax=Reyranella sp. TaxID=1929291 RepID=UPI003BAC0724